MPKRAVRNVWSHAVTVAVMTCAALAFAARDAHAIRLEFSADAKIQTPIPPKGWDIWKGKPIEFSCSWSVKVGDGLWQSSGKDVAVTTFAMKYSTKVKPNYAENLGALKYWTKELATFTDVTPAGVHAKGAGFGGQFKASYVPPEWGVWAVGCYSTAPKLYKALEINKKCDGSTYAWCDVGTEFVFVSRPEPHAPNELPVPEILAPLKAPGGEIITIPLDVIGVPLRARIPSASVPREKSKATAFNCGVSVDRKGNVVGETCPPLPFWEWATTYTEVFVERWHLQLSKRQPSGFFKPVKDFSGLVKQADFEATVAPGFFNIDKDGGGVWRLKAWLSQENTPQGTVTGNVGHVDFEVKLTPKSQPTAVQPTGGPTLRVPGPSGGTARDKPASLAPLVIEGEDLVGRARATAGSVVVQPMASFGPGWSGNAQLFWTGGTPGAGLDLLLVLPAGGTYAVELFATRAPDYGDAEVTLNGQRASEPLYGHAPSVAAPQGLQLGRFALNAGANTLHLTITGKSRASSGYLIGIDRVQLTPWSP